MDGEGLHPDTIVALATAPGIGAVALVRLSGPDAVSIASGLTGRSESQWTNRRPSLCGLRRAVGGDVVDRGLVTVFRGPASYTGEDVVEVSTHGGYQIPREVVEACVALGARRAMPGEFTQRAYLNGKLDLTQAEAVADLVAARSEKGRLVAVHQLERGLGDRVAALREGLIGLSAMLVQHIDFPEEDEAPTPLEAVVLAASRLGEDIGRLLATAPAGELLREGALVVLAGPPNSGKSSLFNALVGTERAIVTEEAGTTRDALEAVVSIDGFPFRLVDTAGLRQDPGRVERLGIEVAHRYLADADLILYCHEVGRAWSAEEDSFIGALGAPVVRVATKSDLWNGMGEGPGEAIRVAALTGDGLPGLRERLRELAFRGVVENRDEVPVVTSRRQAGLLEVAAAELESFAGAVSEGVPPEVASAHLKSAESALEDIVGGVETDEVLDRVFRDFCIGK